MHSRPVSGSWLAILLIASPGPLAAQSSTEELAALLESRDVRTRRDAARKLGEHGSAAAIEALNGASHDADRRVRRAVLDALLSQRRPAAAPGLIAFLEDEEEAHRRDAVGGLVEMHSRESPAGRGTRAMNWLLRREAEFVLDPLRPVDPRIAEALGARLSDEEREIRQLAAEALRALRGASEVAALAHAASEDPDGGVRREAVRALGELRTDEAGDTLLGLLGDPGIRAEVVRALGLMAYPPAARPLLGVYDENPESELGRDSLEALARIGHAGARGTFYHELGSREARRREFAAEGLGRIGDPALVDGLIRDFLREEDERAQLAFCFALARLGQPAFVDRIVLSLPDGRIGEVARQYALELGADLLPELLRYLEDPDREVRLELIALLERLGDAEAVPALEAASTDPDSEVADRARLAARRLAAMEGMPPQGAPLLPP